MSSVPRLTTCSKDRGHGQGFIQISSTRKIVWELEIHRRALQPRDTTMPILRKESPLIDSLPFPTGGQAVKKQLATATSINCVQF